jgi:hypothetical protein
MVKSFKKMLGRRLKHPGWFVALMVAYTILTLVLEGTLSAFFLVMFVLEGGLLLWTHLNRGKVEAYLKDDK